MKEELKKELVGLKQVLKANSEKVKKEKKEKEKKEKEERALARERRTEHIFIALIRLCKNASIRGEESVTFSLKDINIESGYVVTKTDIEDFATVADVHLNPITNSIYEVKWFD